MGSIDHQSMCCPPIKANYESHQNYAKDIKHNNIKYMMDGAPKQRTYNPLVWKTKNLQLAVQQLALLHGRYGCEHSGCNHRKWCRNRSQDSCHPQRGNKHGQHSSYTSEVRYAPCKHYTTPLELACRRITICFTYSSHTRSSYYATFPSAGTNVWVASLW